MQAVSLNSRNVRIGPTVAVLYPRHLKHPLASWRCDDTCTTGSRDESTHDGTALASDLAGDGVGFSDVRTPVTSTSRDDGEFGDDHGTTDGRRDFLGTLDTKPNMTTSCQPLSRGKCSGTYPSKSPTATKALNRVL